MSMNQKTWMDQGFRGVSVGRTGVPLIPLSRLSAMALNRKRAIQHTELIFLRGERSCLTAPRRSAQSAPMRRLDQAELRAAAVSFAKLKGRRSVISASGGNRPFRAKSGGRLPESRIQQGFPCPRPLRQAQSCKLFKSHSFLEQSARCCTERTITPRAAQSLTSTLPDHRLPVIRPILRGDTRRPVFNPGFAASVGATFARHSGKPSNSKGFHLHRPASVIHRWTDSADGDAAKRVSYFATGIVNSAPLLMLSGHRCMTLLYRV
jgi:hypothetical protein